MERYFQKCLAAFMAVCMLLCTNAYAEDNNVALNIKAKSAVLMEASTGTVLYSENKDERLPLASVTKIMTMLLIMEAIDNGKIALTDMVSVSERAMSMGGSTMFLETGEQLSVDDMLKGIAVASANDGCVAMAEHIAGTEQEFVNMMNTRAKELGMENTNFVNTNGLDADGHYSSAYDIALMSRELLKHPAIFNYTTIWMDSLRDGKTQLSNTNKLIRFYRGANGLKTGSTSKALCCLSGAALRDGMQLIAVVMGAPTSADRFSDARALLDYGFASYAVSEILTAGEEAGTINVLKSETEQIPVITADKFTLLSKKGEKGEIEKELVLEQSLTAPVQKGQNVGKIIIKQNGNVIGEVSLLADSDAAKIKYSSMLKKIFASW